jgi:membrane-bound lytic murein transglycosylase A
VLTIKKAGVRLFDPSIELRAGPSIELRAGPSIELRAGPSIELRAGPSIELRAGPSIELRAGPSIELRAGPSMRLRAGSPQKAGAGNLLSVAYSLLALTFLGSCHPGVDSRIGRSEQLVIQDDLDRESLSRAVQHSMDYFAKIPGDRVIAERPRKITAREAKESLVSFLEVMNLWDDPAKLAQAIRSRFDIVPSAVEQGERDILVTGYYRPVIDGSLTPTGLYRFPVYRKPDDLVESPGGKPVPYFSRHEIDILGRLRGKGYEIAWVQDPVELFFLHIQGSGVIRLENGRTLQVNFAASNGRPYTSIGKILVDEGRLTAEEVSAARLRGYLRERPEERERLLTKNERYIFFRFVENGPLGSLEIPLTPGRSVAADPGYFPAGALAFLVSRRPVLDGAGHLAGWRQFSRFVLSQDAGAAIRGPRRLDLYFGSGDEAGGPAGFMNSRGRLYLLLRKKTGVE